MIQTFYKDIVNKDIFNEYVKIINGILNLSNRECELLSLLLKISLEQPGIDMLSSKNRKQIMLDTGFNKSNLSKYISNFKDYGILKLSEKNKYIIHDYFIPKYNNNQIEVLFKLNIND